MAPEPMSAQQATALTEFARTCKAAARAVALYPGTHPAIQSSLGRVVAAAGRLAPGDHVTLEVHPDAILIDGKAPQRPDPAIGELAELLHDRLVGALGIDRHAPADDWLSLLGILGRAPEDVIAGGGVARAWADTGRGHFSIREIDYAEVLRERAGGEAAEWDRIIARCLDGGGTGVALDERTLAWMAEAIGDPARLGTVIKSIESAGGGATIGARAAALMQLVNQAAAAAGQRGGQAPDRILETVDDGIASFVASSVVAAHGATDRLAQAFQALVPDGSRQMRLLDLARTEVERSPLGAEAGFDELWQSAATMLTSYSDKAYVSADYGRELSSAQAQAIEVDRVSDDPPDRVQRWLATVSDAAMRQLDLALLQDLLRLERDAERWGHVAAIAATEVERRALVRDIDVARQLTTAILGSAADDSGRRAAAEEAMDRLATGPLVRHIVLYLRSRDETDPALLNQFCQAIGPRIAKPLAEALAAEENSHAVLRLRELLLAFGAAGRQSVEQLKNSPNPSVRRMAIDLLRVFGGRDALPELASMLDDADPQVQRESIRAIVQIATNDAYAVLERALVTVSASRDTVLDELIALRDDKVIPLLCYVLRRTTPRGALVDVHIRIIEALGGLTGTQDSVRTLRAVLHRGEWWAPARTTLLRAAAAAALLRLGTPEAIGVLDDAVARGSRGVRKAARKVRP